MAGIASFGLPYYLEMNLKMLPHMSDVKEGLLLVLLSPLLIVGFGFVLLFGLFDELRQMIRR